MSTTTSKVMLEAYKQDAAPTMFLAGQFKSPRQNFHNSEEVEIDIVRSEEDISIAITDLSTGARLNSEDIFTNKSFKPPVHKEAAPINAHTLLKRLPGQDPFMAIDFMVSAMERGVRVGKKLQQKILRAIEYQAAQVLTTGTVTLSDENGNAVYAINYAPKATHFPTASIAWSGSTSTKLADLAALANVIRSDGLGNPDLIIMGAGSYELLIKDTAILARLDNLRINGNGIVPLERLGNGGVYRGTIEIENYKYDIYTYGGRYKHPQTGASTAYVPDDKVIMRDSMGRMDATFGNIPRIGAPDPRIPAALVQRYSVPESMADLQMNAWVTQDGETLFVQAGTRPLLIPTAIDTFGCLDTGI